jgi:predicted ATPase/transcriptional regulator with XRE-family HTH domain
VTGTSAEQFGGLLRGCRLRSGLSQEALAERAGLSTRGISDLERAVNRAPQRETMLRLADALALAGDERSAFIALAQRRVTAPTVADGAARRFPAALPVPLTALVGREDDVRALIGLMQPEQRSGTPVRLVTLTGPGGVGKTRLAIAVAASLAATYPDGVAFVPLAGARDPALVLPVVAQSVGLRATSTSTQGDELAAHLRGKRALLVLDNLEHLLAAAPHLAGLLEACPDLTLLVTSRAALRLRGEREVSVPPLALPDLAHLPALEVLEHCPAVALFVERVREHRPSFSLSSATAATVAGVCTRLEGLPLALELAAAQIRIFSPRALLSRLERRLDVLIGGARDLPDRQRTMRATIAWSYDQLDAGEQTVFLHLAVFAGGFTLEAVQAMAAGIGDLDGDPLERLRSLADKSLLWQVESAEGEPRLGMLETIREYGLERLAAGGELDRARLAHARYFAALAAEASPRLRGREQVLWQARLDAEYDNLRAALHWTIYGGGDPELGLRLAASLGYFWFIRGQYREGRGWLQAALALGTPVEDAVRASALLHAGNLVYWLGDVEQAGVEYAEALALWRAAGDLAHVALGLLNVGNVSFEQEDYAAARSLWEEALAIEAAAGDPQIRGRLLNNLGTLAEEQGDLAGALALFEQCAPVWRDLDDNYGLAQQLANIGDVSLRLGELARSRACLLESLRVRHALNDRDGVRWTLHSLSFLARQQAARERAVLLLGAADKLGEELGAMLGAQRQALYDENVAAMREQLGDAAFAETWTRGQAMPYKQAIEYALSA